MGTTAEKLQAIVDSKEAIRQEIIKVGQTASSSLEFDQYAGKIEDGIASILDKSITSIENDKVTSIARSIFLDDINLTSANFPNVTTINAYAFQRTGLTSASFPSLETVDSYAFQDAPISSELKQAIGTEIKTIGEGAFQRTGITSIDYSTNRPFTSSSDDTYAFGTAAFANCTSLTTVKYGFEGNFSVAADNTVLFKQKTFKGCTALTTVTLRCINNATGFLLCCPQLQAEFFSGCTSLTSLTLITKDSGNLYARFSLANVNVFDGITGPITVYVPSGRISAYQTMTNWSQLYNDGKVTFVAIPE